MTKAEIIAALTELGNYCEREAKPYTVTVIRDARDALLQTEWQPIETAPKDGRTILLLRSPDGLVGFASQNRARKAICVGYFDGYWVSGHPGGNSTGGDDSQFTHWMHLPAPPHPHRDGQ